MHLQRACRIMRGPKPVCLLIGVLMAMGSKPALPKASAPANSIPALRNANTLAGMPPALRNANTLAGSSSTEPIRLRVGDRRSVLAYPSEGATSTPVLLFLHGKCSLPQNACDRFQGAASEFGHLICPRGNIICSNGGAQWAGSPTERYDLVASALAAAQEHWGELIDVDQGAVLIGFSQGAYEAVRLLSRGHGPFSYALLMGAHVHPTASMLRQSGVESVLLAAGDYDQTAPTLRQAANALVRNGFRAKYESLGRVGHEFAPDMESWMRGALGWLTNGPTDPQQDFVSESVGAPKTLRP